jgi:hypothetical protein
MTYARCRLPDDNCFTMAKRRHSYRQVRPRNPYQMKRITNFIYDASGVMLGVGVLNAFAGISQSLYKKP